MKNKPTITAYIGLGSNLGDRASYIASALEQITSTESIHVTKVSQMIETAPLEGRRQPNYFNQVAEIRTTFQPENLLIRLQTIEENLGRTRTEKWASRTIDLDILLYDDRIMRSPELIIPHPQMHLRSFVLQCLCDLIPEKSHPVLKADYRTLAKRINGQNFTFPQDRPKLISITGVIGVGKTTLAQQLALMLDAELIEEAYDENPYLSKVYAGNTAAALDSELFFVNSSASQLAKEKLQKDKTYVSDYMFDKAVVYASCWLSEEQMAEYKSQYLKLRRKVVCPAIIINLTDSPETCLARIKERNRPYEQAIDIDFLRKQQDDYKKLLADWKQSPVLNIDGRDIDWLDSKCTQQIARQVKYYIYEPDDQTGPQI